MAKIKELRKLKKEELEIRLDQLRMELIKINAQISTGTPPENPGQVKNTKKTTPNTKHKKQNKQNKKQTKQNKQKTTILWHTMSS